MDHIELLEKIAEKIERESEKLTTKLDRLEEKLDGERTRTAKLEVQVSGIIKVSLLLLTSILGIIGKLLFG